MKTWRALAMTLLIVGSMTLLAFGSMVPVTDAGGFRGAPPPGLSVHGRFGKGHAASGMGAAAGALVFGAGSMWDDTGWREDPPVFTIDAMPPNAWVYLDGRYLGIAGELLAQALPVPFGPHVLQVAAPGYYPWAAQFYADGGYPTRLQANLRRQ